MIDEVASGSDEPVADAYASWDGAYVLGALSAAERREYERHLADCTGCRLAVADLAGVPGLLQRVEPAVALALIEPVAAEPEPEAAPVPSNLLPQLVSGTRARRRRNVALALAGAAAAAVVAVLVAVPATLAVHDHGAPTAVVAEHTMNPVVPTPVSASFRVIAADGGSRIDMTCSYAKSETAYSWRGSLWVVGVDGTESRVADWTALPGTTMSPSGTVALAPDKIKSVQVRSAATNQVVLSSNL
ncbi:zf-HC2 domain-containing protein [Nocardia stercoris]|uniref:Zf-HC2 domain-containing protein n=1 Tax=Nocardia stercoris TaxID=2483361 RepID=A0A3M2L8P4_9NOCA|nr:zf-HC2 domain-containing protein [Nocardia stercoris]RMI33981.1 zf-HC2 domain-containing protein [Nocardia stercoris]